MRQRLRDVSLKTKIQMIVLFCILVLAISGASGIYSVAKAYDKVLYKSVSHSLSGTARGLEEALDEVDRLADSLLSNQVIQERLPMLQQDSSRAEERLAMELVYNELDNGMFNLNKSFLDSISIIQGKHIINTYMMPDKEISEDSRKKLEKIALNGNGSTIWVTEHIEKNELFLVKELRKTKNLSFDYLGTLIININMEKLLAYTRAYEPEYDTCSYGILNGDQVIYESEGLKDEGVLSIMKQLKKPYGVVSSGGERMFAVRSSIPEYGWNFIAAVSYDSISKTTGFVIRSCVAAIVLMVGLAYLFSNRMATSLSRHFQCLIDKMNQFGDGKYTILENPCDYSVRKDEIGQLHRNFNQMALKINTLIRENYISEMLKKEAQLKALESQINPHFLYNTLNSITWRAKAIHAEDISMITTSLGNLLRVTLRREDDFFTLKKELEIVKAYMTIQELRYTKRMEFKMDIENSILDCQFPKLTIQPLLENAIRYGLEECSETCRITVTGREKNGNLILEVKNSGSSFEEGLLEGLERKEIKPNGFGIGLLNIHKRLIITYGNTFGLTLRNEEDECEEYAIARMTLPCIRERREETC